MNIQPRCRHFGSCGGCSLQHIEYRNALHMKEQELFALFSSWKDTAVFHPAIAAKDIWRYRNKMEFTFSQNKNQDRFFGLILARSRGKVFSIEECPIAPEWMMEAVRIVRAFWEESGLQAYNYRTNKGHLRTLTLRESPITHDRMCILTVSGNPDYAIPKHCLSEFVRVMQPLQPTSHEGGKLSVILRIHQNMKGVPTQIYEMKLYGDDWIREEICVLNRTRQLHISPQAFFQPNTKMASVIYERAIALAAVSSHDVVYDLYCGSGSFGIACAHLVKLVIGIELSPDGAYDARTNAERLQIDNYRVIEGDVSKILAEQVDLPRPDCVFLDPPRSGLTPQALKEVNALGAKKIVYVSCNPKTQVENIQTLSLMGYRLQEIQPVDQFPHTAHIENIAILLHE